MASIKLLVSKWKNGLIESPVIVYSAASGMPKDSASMERSYQ
jgi:hypothetical protein